MPGGPAARSDSAALFDAMVVPDGDRMVETLRSAGQAVDFAKDQYRHCKPVLVLGAGAALLSKAGVPTLLPGGKPDPGIVSLKAADGELPLDAFVAAIGEHWHFERQIDPPAV